MANVWTRTKKFVWARKGSQPKGNRKVIVASTIIDDLPRSIPEDAPKDSPVVVLRRKLGIEGIKATNLRWRTWLLLNEAAFRPSFSVSVDFGVLIPS